MLLDAIIVLGVCIIFLFSCCGLMKKLRLYYEEEQTRIRTSDQNRNPNFVEVPDDGIFPSTLSPPPPAYLECDLPPKYEDVIRENKDLPQVHGSLTEVRTHY